MPRQCRETSKPAAKHFAARPSSLVLLGALVACLSMWPTPLFAKDGEQASAAVAFVPPPLHPGGVEFETRKLGPGVYALLSGRAAVDNSGFIVGERGVLVIDAHINGDMARRIQAKIRTVTEKPILYLVNTNYHADHTFGNYAFPPSTRIIAHRKTAEHMRDFEQEKQVMMGTVDSDPAVFEGVKPRLPDLVFDDRLGIDLGGRQVELCFFGAGNTPGDTVVYEPVSGVAWTGNLVVGENSVPFLLEAGPGVYLETLARLSRTLDITAVVPGHGAMPQPDVLERYMRYLGGLIAAVRKARRSGLTLEETVAQLPLPQAFVRPAEDPFPILKQVYAGFHLYNVKRTYRELAETR